MLGLETSTKSDIIDFGRLISLGILRFATKTTGGVVGLICVICKQDKEITPERGQTSLARF